MRTLSLLAITVLFFSGCKEEAVDNGVKQPTAPNTTKKAKETPHSLPLEKEPVVTLTAEELDNGWIQLFDGQTLSGWHANNDVNWHINDAGEIEADTGDAGLLLTNVPFADYELRCDYWVSKGANSGVFLRTVETPKNPAADCYELNIADSHKAFKTASLVARQQPIKEVSGEETWKTFHVTVEGNTIQAKLDGEDVLDFTDESDGQRTNGFIGLQKNEGLVRFRNVYLRPLGGTPLFNGIDLEGWVEVPGSKAKFEVVDQSIHATGGLGFLETEEAWDNFILQFEAKTNGIDVNSGIFYRLNPGTKKNPSDGYEMQIDNGVTDSDRSKPKNSGTGSIFRRTVSRWVGTEDKKWFTATLIAHGDHVAVWVDGLQVTGWTDTRKTDANPRRGLKLGAGPISLQAHDETTDVLFRNLRITEYPVE
jgi:hypothetical protein